MKKIMVVNQKGGVGKSTIAYLIVSKLNTLNESGSVIINIDQTQEASLINPGDLTIDLIDETIDITETINQSVEDEIVVIDTPSNFKPGQADYNRITSIIDDIDLFIVPLKEGKRSMYDSFVTIELLFGKGITKRTKPAKILFVLNSYRSSSRSDIAREEASKYVQNILSEEMGQIELEDNILESINIDYFPYTASIVTIEDNDKTLDELYASNRGAYRSINNNAFVLSKNIMKLI